VFRRIFREIRFHSPDVLPSTPRVFFLPPAASALVPYVPKCLYQAPCKVKFNKKAFDITVLNNGKRNADCEIEILVSYRDCSSKAAPKVAVHLQSYDGSVAWNFEMRNGWSYAFRLPRSAQKKITLFQGWDCKGKKLTYAKLPEKDCCLCKLPSPIVLPACTVFQGAAVLKLSMPPSHANKPGVVLRYKLEGACGSLDSGVYLHPITVTACGTSRITAWATAPGCVTSPAQTRIFTVRCYRRVRGGIRSSGDDVGMRDPYTFDGSDDDYNEAFEDYEDDATIADGGTQGVAIGEPNPSTPTEFADDDGMSYYTAWGDSEIAEGDADASSFGGRMLSSGSKCKKYGKYCSSKYRHRGSGRYRCRVRKMEGWDDRDKCDKYKHRCSKDKYYYKYKGKYNKYCKDKKGKYCNRYPCLLFPRYDSYHGGRYAYDGSSALTPYAAGYGIDYRYGQHGYLYHSSSVGSSWPVSVPGLGGDFRVGDSWNNYDGDRDDDGRQRRHNGHGFSLELVGGRRNCNCGAGVKIGYARPPHHDNIDDDRDHDDYDRGHYRGNHGDGRRGGGHFMRKCLVVVSRRGLGHLSYEQASSVLAYGRGTGVDESRRALQGTNIDGSNSDANSEIDAIHAAAISRHLLHAVDGHTYELDLSDVPQGASVNLRH
jgi:hypothetical protein